MLNRARTRFSTVQGPHIGLWGRFDLPGIGDLLHPRVFEAEIRKRLPGARVNTWSPLGTERPLAVDGGLAPASLGKATPERLEELATAMDALVIGGGELIVARDEDLASDYGLGDGEATARGLSRFFLEAIGDRTGCPVAWNAASVPHPFTPEEASRVRCALAPVRYLSVPDEASRKHLTDAGVEASVTVVPSPLLLSSRVFPPELLERRWEALRRTGAAPAGGPSILIEGSGDPGSALRELLEAVASIAVGKGNTVLVLDDATGADWSIPVYRIPASASLTDRLAAIARSTCVLSSSAGTLLVASSFGVACGFPDPSGRNFPAFLREPGYEELAIVPVALPSRGSIDRLLRRGHRDSLPAEIERRLEKHFDRLAEIVSPAARPRETEVRIEAWRKAYEAISGQMAEQRLRLAERLDASEAAFADASARSEEAERARDLLAATVASLETSLAGSEASALRASEEAVSLGTRLAAAEAVFADASAQSEEAERARDLLAATVASLETSLAGSEASVLRATDEAALLGTRLAGAANETLRLRASLDGGKRQEKSLQAHILDLEERIARERTTRIGVEADVERLATDLAHHAAEATRLAHLEAGSRALSEALSSRMRTVEEDAARWRLEADRFLREQPSETDAAELANAHRQMAAAALVASQRETSSARSETAQVAAELETTRAELVRLSSTRLLRCPEPLRTAYATVRRAFGSLIGRRP